MNKELICGLVFLLLSIGSGLLAYRIPLHGDIFVAAMFITGYFAVVLIWGGLDNSDDMWPGDI